MTRLLRIVAILVVLGALGGGGYWLYTQRVAAQAATDSEGDTFSQTVDARRGSLSSSLTVVGELQAVQSARLRFERMNRSDSLVELKVAAGNTVKAGDVLASIDAEAYQQAVDQAKSDLQAAEERLADMQVPATELELAKADLAIAKAEQDLAQAQQDREDLKTQDLSDLQAAVKSAQDNLKLVELQQSIAQHDSLAKSERELQYAIAWHERKINDLRSLAATGAANAEQTASLAAEEESLSEARADLAKVQAERQLSLKTAAAEVAEARAAVADAQEALAEAQTGDELAVAKAELGIKTAEVSLASAKEARAKLDEGTDATDLAAAQADVDKKRLALADAEAALAGTQLVAPFDGTVLQTNVKAGDTIAANTVILTVADLTALQVVASVDETTIRRVSPGQAAAVTFDALPGQTLQGTVGEVPLQGTLSGGVMVYEVPVAVAGAEGLPLLVGMTANVKIATGSVADALLVPAMALTKANGMYQVLVADPNNPDAEPQAVPVEVGLSDGTYTQIVRGLVEGDKVVVEMTDADSTTNLRGFGGGGVMIMEGGPPPGGGAVRAAPAGR